MGKITLRNLIQIGINLYDFGVEANNLHDVLMEKQKLSFGNVYKCGICGSDNLILAAHTTPGDGYDYTYVRCIDCKATLNFGQQKKNDDIYYLRTTEVTNNNGQKIKVYDWKPYTPQ